MAKLTKEQKMRKAMRRRILQDSIRCMKFNIQRNKVIPFEGVKIALYATTSSVGTATRYMPVVAENTGKTVQLIEGVTVEPRWLPGIFDEE